MGRVEEEEGKKKMGKPKRTKEKGEGVVVGCGRYGGGMGMRESEWMGGVVGEGKWRKMKMEK